MLEATSSGQVSGRPADHLSGYAPTVPPSQDGPAQPVQAVQPAATAPAKQNRIRGLIHVIDRQTPGTPTPPRRPPARRRNTAWTVVAVVAVGLLVVGIIAVGFRGSLGALRDAALASHIEPDAAALYWIGVDGLIVVAIIAALVLRHDREARRYCLTVVGGFTLASWLLNYLHGLGWFTPERVGGPVPALPWGVVLVVASLIIGTIFFGTHLLVYVLRHLFPGTPLDQDEHTAEDTPEGNPGEEDEPSVKHPPEGVSLTPEQEREERKKWAALAYNLGLDKGVKFSNADLAAAFQISTRQAGYVRSDVDEERAEKAAAEAVEQADGKTPSAPNKPINGQVPHADQERAAQV